MDVKQKKIRLNFLAVSLFVMAVSIFFIPEYIPFRSAGDNYFHVYMNGEKVGTLGSREDVNSCLSAARRRIAWQSPDIVYIDADVEVESEEVLAGRLDRLSDVTDRMAKILAANEQRTMERCFTLKIGDFTVNMRSEEDICSLLDTVLHQYDPDRTYLVNLITDTGREVNVYTSEILSTAEQEKKEEKLQSLPIAGINSQLSDFFDAVTPAVGKSFDDYELGLMSISFARKVEVVETYMPAGRISTLDEAIAMVGGDVTASRKYEVVYGDTISGIAAKNGLSIRELIAINSQLENENSMIRPGDELNVTIEEHVVPVLHTDQVIYEEDYQADTIYKNNSSWYTTKQETIQEPVTGHRKVVALVTYQDTSVQNTEIVKQETTVEAVPRIIERGTKSPPTFIWPVSYGYITSGFGYRSRPKAGASTYHQGVDIGVSTGTSVMASSAGTVTVAGWQGGYGNVVYIEHENGVTTRYGHLSRILVKKGDRVYQGQKIALSGNTGNSTGPHLHFEYRINGTAQNPLNYVPH